MSISLPPTLRLVPVLCHLSLTPRLFVSSRGGSLAIHLREPGVHLLKKGAKVLVSYSLAE